VEFCPATALRTTVHWFITSFPLPEDLGQLVVCKRYAGKFGVNLVDHSPVLDTEFWLFDLLRLVFYETFTLT
jgi:hypothetical protein